jgi:hypothetical protein
MANRILAGNRATGGYGLYVSKANSNVLTCDRKELLFDSSQKRAGDVYAGGTQSSTSGQNFLTTSSKASLGYIPLVISTEDKRGERDYQDGDEEFYQSRTDFIETTINSVTPKTMDGQISSSTSALPSPVASRETASACTNFKFMVLKIPCAYGYMTSANFDT